MFPGPDPIPAVTDCPALANSGVDALPALLIGLAILAFGILFLVVSRNRLRGRAAALGLVLLLAVGGSGLAVSAPASSASADDCTPLDYAITGFIGVEGPVTPPTAVVIFVDIVNVVDRDGTTPIVVRIPKTGGPGWPILAGSPTLLNPPTDNWTLDNVGDLNNYVLTYSGPLPKGTMSSEAQFSFTTTNPTIGPTNTDIPVTIDTGSGGDTNTSNNSMLLNLQLNQIVVP